MTTTVADRVIAAITNLGPTADDVADRLRARGIKGWQGNAGACPLARVIRAIPGAENALVAPRTVYLGYGAYVYLTPGTETVRRWFDRGVYLDLIDSRPAGTWQEQIEGGAE
jgi:hypothetical protein